MRCSSCGTELIPGKRFCQGCGARAQAACPSCGASVDLEFRFCPDCGARLADESPAPAEKNGDRLRRLAGEMPELLAEKIRATRTTAGERKLVTVLFCDLVGSTAIAERLDPEEYRDLLEGYIALGLREVYRFEGIVNQLAGDGFMALFGAPVAHEDAPERALRAALAIRDALGELNRSRASGPELRVRIGIHSGPVVVGAVGNDLKMDYTAIGDTTNLASRLQSLAEPGMILLSEATYRLVRDVAKVRPMGPLHVRGKRETVATYALEGMRRALAIGISDTHGLTPLVGRTEELAQLLACYERAARGLPQIVTVVGGAGNGKSRLIYEFKRQIKDAEALIFEGRCSSLTKVLPYSPFVSMFGQFFGLAHGTPGACEKIASKLQDLGQDQALHPHLCRMFTAGHEALDKLPAEEAKNETLHAITGFLHQASQRAPVLIMIEDLQWIDDLSREVLDLATGRMKSARIMLLLSHRPDYHHDWRVRAALTQLNLYPLTDEETGAIVRAVVGSRLPDGLERRILAKAEGNPFFAEEIARVLIEEGYVVSENGQARLTRALDEISIPDTVQEVLGARLDRLSQEAKRVVHVAAVLGRQFDRTRLAQVLEDEGIDIDAALAELERRGVIHRKTALSRDEFRFGESLAQEVAYETLLMKERKRLHERIAQLLEHDGGAKTAETRALVAHHFALSDNDARAVQSLLEAAQDAEAVPSYGVAHDLYRRAWERAEAALRNEPADAAKFLRWAFEGSFAVSRVTVLYGTSADPNVEAVAARAHELAEQIGDQAALAGVLTYQGLLKTGRRETFQEGLRLIEQALDITHRTGLEMTQISISRGLAWSYLLDGQLERAHRTITWIVAALEQAAQREEPSDVYFGAIWMENSIRYYNDDFEGALQGAKETYELALRAANRTMESSSGSLISQIHYVRGQYEEARDWAGRCLQVAESIGSTGAVHRAAAMDAAARAALGESAAVSRYADLLERGITAGGNLLTAIVFIVDSFLQAADLERAERIARKGYELAAGRFREMQACVALGDVTRRLGACHWNESRSWYDRAIELATTLSSRSALGVAFLGAAELEAARGDVAAARRALDEATRIFADLGLGHYARRAEALAVQMPAAVSQSA